MVQTRRGSLMLLLAVGFLACVTGSAAAKDKSETSEATASAVKAADPLSANPGVSLSDLQGLGDSCGENSYRCTGFSGCFRYTSDCGERQAAVKPGCCCLGDVVAQAEDNGWKYAGSFGQEAWCKESCTDLCMSQASKTSMVLESVRCIGCTKGSCPKYVVGYSQQDWDGLSDSTKNFFNQVGRNVNGKSSGTALCPSGDEDCFCKFRDMSTQATSSQSQAATASSQVKATASSSQGTPDTLALNTGISVSDLEGLGSSCGENSYKCAGYLGCFQYKSDCGERHPAVKPACCCLDQVVAKAENNGWRYVGSFGQESWCSTNCSDLCKKQAAKSGVPLRSARCIGCTKGSCPKYVVGYSQEQWDGLSDSTKDFFKQVGRNANGQSSGTALCPSGDEDCFCQF